MRDNGYRLIACPVCDFRYPHVHHDLIERYFRCVCDGCGAYTEAVSTEERAIDDWNEGRVKVEF